MHDTLLSLFLITSDTEVESKRVGHFVTLIEAKQSWPYLSPPARWEGKREAKLSVASRI